MEFGLYHFATPRSLDLRRLAEALERFDFDAVFAPEHTHWVPGGSSPFPAGGTASYEHRHLYDPFIVLATIAALTARVKVGTAVCLVSQREPIVTAKLVASLDRLSGGRVLFGVGAGWNREELANHGVDWPSRMPAFEASVEAVRRLWRERSVDYAGAGIAFSGVDLGVAPVRADGPPLLVGGWGPSVIDRVIRIADGWIPREGRQSRSELRERLARLRADFFEARGRHPEIVLTRAQADPESLADYAAMGVSMCLFDVPGGATDEECWSVLADLGDVIRRFREG